MKTKLMKYACLIVLMMSCNLYGQDWSTVNSGTSSKLNKVKFINDNDGFIIGENGTLLHTTDGGVIWTSITTNVTHHLLTITFVDQMTGYINGLKTTDGGNTWNIQNATTDLVLIEAIDANNLIGGSNVTFDGSVLQSTDGGENWTAVSTPIPSGFYTGASFPSSTTGYLVSWYGAYLAKTIDGGTTWNQVTTIPNLGNEAYGVSFPTVDTGIVVSTGPGEFYKTVDGGATWNSIFPSSGNSDFSPYAIATISSDIYVVVGKNYLDNFEMIYTTIDGGANWTLSNSQTTFGLLDVDCNTQNCFAVGENGLILKNSASLSVQSIANQTVEFILSPNPTNDIININGDISKISQLSMFDIFGRSYNVSIDQLNSLNVSELNSGQYFLQINSEHYKFIKE